MTDNPKVKVGWVPPHIMLPSTMYDNVNEFVTVNVLVKTFGGAVYFGYCCIDKGDHTASWYQMGRDKYKLDDVVEWAYATPTTNEVVELLAP